MNSYELSRNWFDWCFDNPEKVKPIHSALFFFAIEHCNRLGWKDKFGFPSQMVMEALGVKNWRTYSKALNDLVSFGFIEMIEISKNQYSSNIIAIVKNTKADTKALDKALQKHSTKQGQSTVSINKQYNKEQTTIVDFDNFKTQIQENNKIWSESFYMNFKLKEGSLSKLIDLFINHLKLKDEKEQPKNIKDFKNHFYNWCNVQDRIQKLDKYKKNPARKIGSL